MITDQLRVYVKAQFAKGVKAETLNAALLKAGWQEADASAVIQEVYTPVIPAVSETLAAPQSSTPLITPSQFTIPKSALQEGTPAITDISPATASLATVSDSSLSTMDKLMELKNTSLIDQSSRPTSSENVVQKNTVQISTEPEVVQSSQEQETAVSSIHAPDFASINAEVYSAKSENKKASPLIVGLLVVIVVGAGVFVYWYLTKEETFSSTPAPAVVTSTSTPSETAGATAIPPVEDPDITNAKLVFAEIQQANSKKDVVLERRYLSEKTLATIASSTKWQPVWYKNIEFLLASKEGDTVVISVITTKDIGATSTNDMVFVKEGGSWKLGLTEALDREAFLKTMATSTATSTP